MKKIFCIFVGILLSLPSFAATGACDDGYVVASHNKVDGIDTVQCQKLWCMDLETGKYMGVGARANAGYEMTSEPQYYDKSDHYGMEIACFGQRKWCAGEAKGQWNSEYGAYTYLGEDNQTYTSYLKGSCFAWRLETPSCPDGQVAVMDGNSWLCVDKTAPDRAPSIHRPASVRIIGR